MSRLPQTMEEAVNAILDSYERQLPALNTVGQRDAFTPKQKERIAELRANLLSLVPLMPRKR